MNSESGGASSSPQKASKRAHGYHGFKLYFYVETAIDLNDILNKVSCFEDYIKRNKTNFSFSTIKKEKTFFIDICKLTADTELQLRWDNFESDININTEHSLACIGLAMHQTIALDDLKETETSNLPLIHARIENYQPIQQLKNVKVNSFGNLVSIRGTVIKASNVRLLCRYMSFACANCKDTQIVNQPDGIFTPPTKCPSKGCKAKSNFTPVFSSDTHTISWQSLKIQELVGVEQNENGRVPRSIECDLTEDLVGCCIPGDDITVTGVIRVRNTSEIRQRKNQPALFVLYIDAVTVVNNKNQSQATNEYVNQITFSTNDYYAIQKIHAEPSLFRFLVLSLCPNIYGNEIVKAGLLLSLFGGTQGPQGDVATRSLSHVLMVGDPGLGKSNLLQACRNVAPRGVYVCGNTSSTSGLTVTMCREPHGDYSLEAGALILADQGCCCIDEFDKMTSQHACLLEAMEQQSISIAKAGVTCNLAACTSILAAANPAGGHYDKGKTVTENLKISSPLISRFDLIFILLDQPCEKNDLLLSEHVLGLYSGVQNNSNLILNSSMTVSETSLKNRLKLQPEETVDLLPHPLLRKYIAYAQKYVYVTVSKEAQKILKDFYLKLRKECQSNNESPITARQLESMLRLTQARAKVELREEATAADAVDVVEIMRHSFLGLFTDQFGGLDFQRSQNGTGMSKQGQVKKFLAAIQNKAEHMQKSTFARNELQSWAEEIGISKNKFYEILQSLNFHGFLLKRSTNTYQLMSVDFM